MTHRDRAGDPSGQRAGRREAAGDAGHRQGFPTPAHSPAAGSPARPERRLPKAFGPRIAFRRGAWLPMSRIATPRAPGRKPWEAVSMSHYQRSLVLKPIRSSAPWYETCHSRLSIRFESHGFLRRAKYSGATGPLWLWHSPSDHQARAGLHGGGPVAGPDPARRSCQDQPTRRGEFGQAAPGGRAGRGLSSRGGARGDA